MVNRSYKALEDVGWIEKGNVFEFFESNNTYICYEDKSHKRLWDTGVLRGFNEDFFLRQPDLFGPIKENHENYGNRQKRANKRGD